MTENPAPAPKRRKFWIDAPRQLRFLALITALLAGGLALAYIGMDHGLQEAARRTQSVVIPVDWARQALRGPFFFSSLIILLAAAVLSLLWSHSLIGPLLVLTAGLRRVREGNLKVDLRIRGTDALRGIIDDFAAMQAALRKHVAQDRERLTAVELELQALERKLGKDTAAAELEAVRRELARLTSFFRL